MAFQKGQTGNPGGRGTEKPFRDALRMELASAGEDSKALRTIARSLIEQAQSGEIPAIREIADRLDGKPAQDTNLNVAARRVSELSDDELIGAIDTIRTLLAGRGGEANGAAAPSNGSGKPH